MKVKINFGKMGTFLEYLLGSVLGIAIAFLTALPWGVGYAIDWVTNLVLLAAVLQASNDLVRKIKLKYADEPKNYLCWQYIVGEVGILACDVCFLAASKQTETNPFFVLVAVTALLIVLTAVWFNLVVKKAYAKRGL